MEHAHSEKPSLRTRLLRAVKKPSRDLANVRRLIPESSKEALDEALAVAARHGRLDVVHELLPLCDPKAKGSMALYRAAGAGHLDVVRQLLPVSGLGAGNGNALVSAALGGHAHVLRELLPITEMHTDIELALYGAAVGGHVEAVRELILVPIIRPEARTQALHGAAENGHLDVVHELLPVGNVAVSFRHATESIVQLVFERGLEAAKRSAPLVVLNALAPYVEKEDLERALNALLEAPKQLLAAAPQLTAFHAAAQMRAAAPPANTPRAPRASL
jgi:ankyrin repeat protein